MKTLRISLFILFIAVLMFGCGTGTKPPRQVFIHDIDGNEYPTVTIGNQVWMAKNLRTTKYNDGTPIPEIVVDSIWKATKSGAYCWFGNDSATYKSSYGAYYNWYAVGSGKLCPTGWHVPGDKEFRTLTDFFGGEVTAGIDLKSASGWSKGGNGTDAGSFSAIPAGYRNAKGSFGSNSSSAYFWSSTPSGANSWYMVLFGKDGTAYKYYGIMESGFSIRCVKN